MKKLTRCLSFVLAFFMLTFVINDMNATTVNAESTKSINAKDAYYKFLSNSRIPWRATWYGDKNIQYVKAGYCKFDIGDIDNDGIPELYIYARTCEAYMGRILTYKNGKVVPFKIGGEEYGIGNIGLDDSFASQPSYYKGKNIIMFKTYHASKRISYYSTKSKKMVELASFEDSWQPDMDRKHSDCMTYRVNGKETTQSNYDKYVKKLIGNTKKTTFSLKSNSDRNRQKYLYRYGVIPKLNNTSLTLKKGKTYTLKVSGEDILSIRWKSSDSNIAKVSSKGKVTAVGRKKTKSAKITCTVKTKKHTFTLYSKVKVKS